MNVIDEIKSRIDIVDLVSETVKLRRSGKNYTGFCPFHSNTRTPAFAVFQDSGTWRCFGECNEGGDVFKFVMKKEGVDFGEALKLLAKRAGVALEAFSPARKEESEQVDRLRHLLEEALIFYRSHLLQSPAGQEANRYLIEKRGLTAQSIEAFGIGYAPEGWEVLINHFISKGYTNEELSQAGLTVEKDSGGYYDRFRNRILFPVRDASGHMAGFGARVLNPQDMPKFINSPQTILFDKSRLLYGLDQAHKVIREKNQAVIVEGYLDVVVLHQEGFKNVVSPMGTALTEAQMRQVKRYARQIVMALDPDAAGIKATLRGLEVARESLDHSDDVVFDARGLIHHESRLQADLRVCTLPEGMDPDDIVRQNHEQWQTILASAKPIITHVMQTLSQGEDLDDPKIKSQIANQVIPLIGDVPNAVERDAYRQQLARLLRVDERSLTGIRIGSQTQTGRRKRGEPQEESTRDLDSKTLAQDSTQGLERHCLQVLMQKPELIFKVNRILQSSNLNEITMDDFQVALHQQIAQLVMLSLDQDDMEPIGFIQEKMPEALSEFAQELTLPLSKKELPLEKVIEDLFRTVLLLRKARIDTLLEQLKYLQGEDDQSADSEAGHFSPRIIEMIRMRGKIDLALNKPVLFN